MDYISHWMQLSLFQNMKPHNLFFVFTKIFFDRLVEEEYTA